VTFIRASPERNTLLSRAPAGQQANAMSSEITAPNDLSMTGWSAIFAPGRDPAIRQALESLLAARHTEAGDLF
jgi:hypothetical protein